MASVSTPTPATSTPPQAATPSPGSHRRLQGLRILAAEDNQINQMVLAEFLRLEAADTVFVDNGQAAIDCIRDPERQTLRSGPDGRANAGDGWL